MLVHMTRNRRAERKYFFPIGLPFKDCCLILVAKVVMSPYALLSHIAAKISYQHIYIPPCVSFQVTYDSPYCLRSVSCHCSTSFRVLGMSGRVICLRPNVPTYTVSYFSSIGRIRESLDAVRFYLPQFRSFFFLLWKFTSSSKLWLPVT